MKRIRRQRLDRLSLTEDAADTTEKSKNDQKAFSRNQEYEPDPRREDLENELRKAFCRE